MNDTLLALLVGLGGALFTPVAVAAGKFISQAIQLQTLKLGNSKWNEIKLIASVAVSSSEQLANSGQVKDKKEHAMRLARKMLESKKIKIDDDILSELIEAQVWEGINSTETPQPAPSAEPGTRIM